MFQTLITVIKFKQFKAMQCMNDFHIAFFRSRQVTLQDVEESDTFVYKRERQGQRNCFSASLGPLIDIARHPLDIQNVER